MTLKQRGAEGFILNCCCSDSFQFVTNTSYRIKDDLMFNDAILKLAVIRIIHVFQYVIYLYDTHCPCISIHNLLEYIFALFVYFCS